MSDMFLVLEKKEQIILKAHSNCYNVLVVFAVFIGGHYTLDFP